jgi:hypothetical protein
MTHKLPVLSQVLGVADVLGCAAAAMPFSEACAANGDQAKATKNYALKAEDFIHSVGLEKAKAAFTADRKSWLLGPDKFNLRVAGMSEDHTVCGRHRVSRSQRYESG